ncbi:hypothetical protein D3C72_2063900 [compost metagenome]
MLHLEIGDLWLCPVDAVFRGEMQAVLVVVESHIARHHIEFAVLFPDKSVFQLGVVGHI